MSRPSNYTSPRVAAIERELDLCQDTKLHIANLRLTTVLGIAGFGAAVTTFLIIDYPVLAMINFSFMVLIAYDFDRYYRFLYIQWATKFKLLHDMYRHYAQGNAAIFHPPRKIRCQNKLDFHSKRVLFILSFIWFIAAIIIATNQNFNETLEIFAEMWYQQTPYKYHQLLNQKLDR